MISSRKITILLILIIALTLLAFYFLHWIVDNPAEFLKKRITEFSENTISDIQYSLTRKKYRLTVSIGHPPDIVNSVQVYQGSHKRLLGNPKTCDPCFPDAQLVDEKEMDPSGTIVFFLKPGRYFTYPIINYESKNTPKGGMMRFDACPEEVYLVKDSKANLCFHLDI